MDHAEEQESYQKQTLQAQLECEHSVGVHAGLRSSVLVSLQDRNYPDSLECIELVADCGLTLRRPFSCCILLGGGGGCSAGLGGGGGG